MNIAIFHDIETDLRATSECIGGRHGAISGIEPVWSPTGREIFYRSVDGRRLIAVDVQVTPVFSAGTPRLLFEGPYPLGTSFWSDYDVFPGGQEFLMIAADAIGSEALHVAINWIAEVRPRLGNPE